MAGSISSVTNSTIVAIGQHLLMSKRRRYFSASLSHILTISIARLRTYVKYKHLNYLILSYFLKFCLDSVDDLTFARELLFILSHDISFKVTGMQI